MTPDDKPEFVKLMNDCVDYYSSFNINISPRTAEIYWNGLLPYSIEQIRYALNRHMQTPKSGDFFPRISSLIAIFEGDNLTQDDMLALAETPVTPLGVIARIIITSWTLEHEQDQSRRRQAASRVIQLLPNIKQRAAIGDYTPAELAAMQKYGVDPKSPLNHGMPPPTAEAIANMREVHTKATALPWYQNSIGQLSDDDYMDKISSPRELALPAPDAKTIDDVRAEFAALGNGNGADLHNHPED